MGLVFLIKFDQTPNNCFYLCRCCQAHIASSQHYHFGFSEEGLSGSIFSSLANVHTLGPEHDREVGDYKVTNVYCNQCCNVLGVKIIEVPDEELNLCEDRFLTKDA
ncbi:uncharacterized protein LOC130767469 [Actinidia eriantha]|uniref:uncharacterized protein LOC130767469 n=1 Tax=Actinidia eriantha TaxID=165200 RepID=UPI0025871B76|nr:uncharacterized protein LOC130767469 [Actinidia eriantha]